MRFLATVAAVLLLMPSLAVASEFGRLEGDVVARWLPDGRNMRLEQAIRYYAPDGSRWEAPAGLVTDGASIPGFLWSIIGSPFAGKHRHAAVIHDHYCETKNQPWRKVHRVFYLASRAAGVDDTTARIMYFAVYRFGPRWERTRSGDPSRIVFKPRIVREEFDAMKRRIEAGEVNLDAIERSADRSLRRLSRTLIE